MVGDLYQRQYPSGNIVLLFYKIVLLQETE